MKEKNMLNYLRTCYPKTKFTSIESPSTEPGIPDVHYKGKNWEGWIELKQGIITKEGFLKIIYRPGQVKWLTEYIKKGGRGLVIITVKDNWFVIADNNFQRVIKNPLKYAIADPTDLSDLVYYF